MNATKEKYYTCKYDRAFKEVIVTEEDTEILKCLLESILKVEINKIKIKNNERNVGNIKVKRKIVDAILSTNIGIIEIEVNSCIKKYTRARNMAYLADIYASDTLKGEDYKEEKKYIQINLTYEMKEEKGRRIYRVMDEEGKAYVSNLIIYEINMEYYKNIWYNKDEKGIEENKYIIMLDLEREELKKLSLKDKVVEKYMEKLDEVNFDYEFKEYMSAEEDARKIQNTMLYNSRKEGKLQGEMKTKKEIALEMSKKGIDKTVISECTGLMVQEIDSLLS